MGRLGLILSLLAIFLLYEEARAQTKDQKELRQLSRSVRLRHNRVEGLFLGYRIEGSPKTGDSITLFAESGYGLHSRSFRWEAGAEWRGDRVTTTATAFDRTESPNREFIRTEGNSISSLLFKGDYRSYYRAKNGFETKTIYRLRPSFHLLGSFTAFAYESMPVETEWSILYPDKRFRANPEVRPGNFGRIQFGFIADTRAKSPIFRNAWFLKGVYERGFREFSYDGIILTVKRYQKVIFGNQAFVLHARVGTRESSAEQHRFYLGGVGTLRGFGIKEFFGNRMILINWDYLFRGDLFSRLPIRALHLLNLILFVDTGWISPQLRDKHLFEGFQDVCLQDFETDAGLALAFSQQLFRINVARRLDKNSDPWTFSLRLMRKL